MINDKMKKINIIDWDYLGINEIKLIVEVNGVKFSGCLTEINEELEK